MNAACRPASANDTVKHYRLGPEPAWFCLFLEWKSKAAGAVYIGCMYTGCMNRLSMLWFICFCAAMKPAVVDLLLRHHENRSHFRGGGHRYGLLDS